MSIKMTGLAILSLWLGAVPASAQVKTPTPLPPVRLPPAPMPLPTPNLTPSPGLTVPTPQLGLPEQKPVPLPDPPRVIVVPPADPPPPPDPILEAADEMIEELSKCLARGEYDITTCLGGEREVVARRLVDCLGSPVVPGDPASARACVTTALK